MVRLSKNWRPKTEVVRFTRGQAIEIYRALRDAFSKDQPLPKVKEISQEGLNKLDGCLGNISQQIKNKGYAYKPGIEAATAYFYFVNKSHWLFNGNKRSSMMFALSYLEAHNRWLRMSWAKLYNLARKVAIYEGQPRVTLEKIKGVFQEALIDYKEGVWDELIASWEWPETQ